MLSEWNLSFSCRTISQKLVSNKIPSIFELEFPSDLSSFKEKIDILRILGAEVTTVPVVPITDPNNYNHQVNRDRHQSTSFRSKNLSGATFRRRKRKFSLDKSVRQSSEPRRPLRHYWTGDLAANRSILRRTKTKDDQFLFSAGKVNAVVMSTGTGGTLAGVSMFLKEKNPKIRTVLADPPVRCRIFVRPRGNRVFVCWTGECSLQFHKKRKTRSNRRQFDNRRNRTRKSHWKLERRANRRFFVHRRQEVGGNGSKRRRRNDSCRLFSSFKVFRLLYDEGFFVGASSGLNVAAAVELSKSMPKGSTIVTCLCDNGQVFLSSFLRS